MTIRKKFLLATAAIVALALVELALVVALLRNEEALVAAHERQLRSLLLANELRYSSDELTRTARTYVVTGDAQYRDEYWHILAVRNGQAARPDGRTVPLRALFEEAGFTPAEFEKLKTAEDNSNALVATEVAAFQAMQGRFVPEGRPLTVRDADYTRAGPRDQPFAIRIMHDRKYYDDKDLIMRPIGEFEQMMRARTQGAVDALQGRGAGLLWWIVGLTALLVLAAGGAHWFIQRPVLRSLQLVTGELEELAAGDCDLGRRLQCNTGDEVGALAAAFNAFLANLATLVTEVRGEAAAVVARTGEMAALLGGLQTSVEEQRAGTQATTVAAREIAATSAELRRTTGHMADTAGQTSTVVGAGRDVLARIGAGMGALVQANQLIVAKLSVINDRVAQINAMADTIRRVTDHTNLLSLNAAVEAVKAGEFGLGFSVVAQEIRRLADQSADSTVEIENVLREVRRAVDAGVMEMDRFRGRLNESAADVAGIQEQLGGMIGQVQKLLPLLEEVRSTFGQQDAGVQQINEAMIALNDKVEATAATLERARANRAAVEAAGRRLQQLVERMKT